MSCSILWFRRDLRLYDHKILHHAISEGLPIQPVFVFDKKILKRFSNKDDTRLSFLAETLILLSKKIKKNGGELLIFHGIAEEIIPEIVKILDAEILYAGKDFEPATMERDRIIAEKLSKYGKNFSSLVDHLIIDHRLINKKDGSPYRVFFPFSKNWRGRIQNSDFKDYNIDIKNKFFSLNDKLKEELKYINHFDDPKILLEKIGYNYKKNIIFPPANSHKILDNFAREKLSNYPVQRNYMGEEGVSTISPYLRFGLVSIRECYRKTINKENADRWITELIWREFYSMILAKFPEFQETEFLPEFRNLHWNHNEKAFELFENGQTGYPLIDAAIRQMLETGWMHNRMRMVTANFLCKNMFMDWRLGEEFFAQYLMDYELSSNLGGWQWAASAGADPQPYFRSFNPFLQSEKFDPEGKYIKKYVEQLKNIDNKFVHRPHIYKEKYGEIKDYPDYLIKYNFDRNIMRQFFREKKRVEIDYNINYIYYLNKNKPS